MLQQEDASLADLKRLKCRYSTEPEVLARVARNYGRKLANPLAVCTPKDSDDLCQVVSFASEWGLPLALKGFGHCAGRQQEARSGLLVDIRSLNRIHGIQQVSADQRVIIAEAGASWKEVVSFALRAGLMPPVYTDWLMLTLGGTLSYGGVGSASFKRGLQTDWIKQAEMVTGTGQEQICSADHNTELFQYARAGLGQLGVFTQFHFELVSAPEKVSLFKVVYTDPQAFLEDSSYWANQGLWDGILGHFEWNQKEIIEKRIGRAHLPHSGLEGIIQSSRPWLGILEFTLYHSSDSSLVGMSLLETRKNWDLVFQEEYSLHDYLNRVPPILDSELEHEGAEHEECTVFLPFEAQAQGLVTKLLESSTGEDFGFGTILFVPLKSKPITTPLFRKPQSEDFFLLGLLRRVLPQSGVSHQEMVEMNQRFYAQALDYGGYRYPCDSTSGTDWAKHYGELWSSFQEMKKKYDPNGTLSPGLGIFL